MLDKKTIVAAALALATAACSAAGSNHSLPMIGGSTDTQSDARSQASAVSVLKLLTKQSVIGSTVDPTNGDQNPYGLSIPSFTSKKVIKNNEYVCNFNNSKNVQGTGTTIISLHPTSGSSPSHWLQSSSLLGCASLAFDFADNLWAASFGAKSVISISPAGKIVKKLTGGNYVRPWGLTYATSGGLYPSQAIFSSDASTGSIILVATCQQGYCTYPGTAIITGFKVNHGKPGSIFGPSGLAFDENTCGTVQGKKVCGTLFVVDGANNTVVKIYNALNLRNKASIKVGATGKTFSGPDGSWAHLMFAGSPLKGPISTALLYSSATAPANLVVGNTLGPNDLVEMSSAGKVLDTKNVDKGVAGALFGMQAVGTGSSTVLYFNDDNANNVQALSK